MLCQWLEWWRQKPQCFKSSNPISQICSTRRNSAMKSINLLIITISLADQNNSKHDNTTSTKCPTTGDGMCLNMTQLTMGKAALVTSVSNVSVHYYTFWYLQ